MDSLGNTLFVALLLISIRTIAGGIPLQEQNDCQWEGHKIGNPEFPDKLFLCHFYGRSRRWLLYPFNCIPQYHFDSGTQKCVRINPIQSHPRKNEFLLNSGYHPDENLITEVPDPQFTFDNQIMKRTGSPKTGKEAQNPKNLTKKTKSERDDCGESLRSLSSTIAALSKTIEKLSAKINNGPTKAPSPNNATITLKFPAFFPFGDPMPKLEEMESTFLHKNLTPGPRFQHGKPNGTVFNRQATVHRPIIDTTASKTAIQLPAIGQSETLSGEKNKEPPGLKPGNNFLDFLMKNILSPLPVPVRSSPPPHHQQAPKNPFAPLNLSRPSNYGIFKPLPFRPRPPMFTPPSHSSNGIISPEKVSPQIPGFVNVLSFLKKLHESPLESDEDQSSVSEEWTSVMDHLGSTQKPSTVVAITTPSPSTVTTLSTLSPVSMTTSSRSSSSPAIGGSGPSPTTSSSEFDDNDEAEDGGGGDAEFLRLNNRKPRRV